MSRNYLNTTNPFAKRILEIVKEYNMVNLNNLSIELGMVNNSVLTRVFQVEDRILSGENLQRFLIRFKDLNARWFILGEGQMREKSEFKQAKSSDDRIKDEKIKDLLMRIDDKELIIKLQDDKIKLLEQKCI
jgi:hypothetical protein